MFCYLSDIKKKGYISDIKKKRCENMHLHLNKAEITAILNLIDFYHINNDMIAEALASFIDKINMEIRDRDNLLDEKVCTLIEVSDEVKYLKKRCEK